MRDMRILQLSIKYLFLFGMVCSFHNTSVGQDWTGMDVNFCAGETELYNSGINGMVAPQFSNIDFNGDGADDLFVFDRQGGVTMSFIWDGTKMVFAPEYTQPFPEMLYFALLRDYDRDGDQDLFTYSSTQPASSISLYQNEGSDAAPVFRLVEFPDAKAHTLNYESDGKGEPIYTASTDVPAIVDVDGDGDQDVLSFESSSGSYLHYYKNMQVERSLPKDQMVFIFEDFCWGKFIESGFDSEIKLSASSTDCASSLTDPKGSGTLRHGGSTINVLDGDGDGDMDILIGDLSNANLIYLENGGTTENAWMTEQDNSFPSYDTSIYINQFLSSFYVDVDNDGIRELVVAPNETNSSQNQNHIWLYDNVGTDAAPIFQLKTKSFLIENSLQIPESSRPALVDVDQDGLLDLVVGCYGYNTEDSYGDTRLFYFKNVGSATEPKYAFQTDDYLGLSTLKNVTKLDPVFGDLNGDGAIDLLIGTSEGELIYYPNKAEKGEPMRFTTPILSYMDIDIGRNAHPEIVDLDGDGLVDLLVGENNDNIDPTTGRKGGVNYFKNIGTKENPSFSSTPTNQALGGIFTKKTGYVTTGSSAPKVVKTENGDDFLIFVGSNYGDIYVYGEVTDHISDEFKVVSESISIPRQGRRTGLSIADIDADDYYELCVGNDNGGIAFFNTPYKVDQSTATIDDAVRDVQIYPNPTSGRLSITSEIVFDRYMLVDPVGNIVQRGHFTTDIVCSHLPSGLYLLRLINDKTELSKKILVIR